MSVLFIGDLIIREVRTTDPHVKGVVRKFEIVTFQDPYVLEPLYDTFDEEDAYREAAKIAASL